MMEFSGSAIEKTQHIQIDIDIKTPYYIVNTQAYGIFFFTFTKQFWLLACLLPLISF